MSRVVVTSEYEAARLARATEDARWRQYDAPTYKRAGPEFDRWIDRRPTSQPQEKKQ